MKNHNKLNTSLLMITAKFDHSWFLPGIIEEMAATSFTQTEPEPVPADSVAIISSTLEAFVSGNTILSDSDCHHHFTTGFLFTCVKPTDGSYKLTWSNSLS